MAAKLRGACLVRAVAAAALLAATAASEREHVRLLRVESPMRMAVSSAGSHGQATAAQRRHRLYMWTSGRWNLGYMYRPFMETLAVGLASYAGISSWDVRRRSFEDGDDVYGALDAELPLQRGDVFIWVAYDRLPKTEFWELLSRNGVYTVYYNSEPLGWHPIDEFATSAARLDEFAAAASCVSEVWDYSRHNIEAANMSPTVPRAMRYLPTGFLSGEKRAVHSAVQPPPTFFGTTSARPCFNSVDQSFDGGSFMEVELGVWSEAALDAFMGSHSIVINLPRGCEPNAGVVTSRLSELLSAGCFVVSMTADPKDEAEFQGLVTFAPLERLPAEYRRIADLDPAERSRRSAELVASYSERFLPTRLFQRAGIYALLDQLAAAAETPERG